MKRTRIRFDTRAWFDWPSKTKPAVTEPNRAGFRIRLRGVDVGAVGNQAAAERLLQRAKKSRGRDHG
jgi:hypothetical protein